MTHPLLFASVSAILFVSAAAQADESVRTAYNHLADGKVIMATEVAVVSGHLPSLPLHKSR